VTGVLDAGDCLVLVVAGRLGRLNGDVDAQVAARSTKDRGCTAARTELSSRSVIVGCGIATTGVREEVRACPSSNRASAISVEAELVARELMAVVHSGRVLEEVRGG
jgi:hypothetical protein